MAKRPTDTIIGIFSLKCNLSGMHGECDMMQGEYEGEKGNRHRIVSSLLLITENSSIRTVCVIPFSSFLLLRLYRVKIIESSRVILLITSAKRQKGLSFSFFSYPHHYFSSRTIQNFSFFNFLFQQCLPGGREGDKGPI